MGMTRIQETYHSLINDYDETTKNLAEQVHKLYTEGLKGNTIALQQLKQLDPVLKVENLSARATMRNFVDLVEQAILNQ